MMEEIWLPIKYGNGKKEISNYGNVRNAFTKRILRSYTSKRNGYRNISFFINKDVGSKSFKIHRLVAEHFLPEIKGKHHVNHLDFNKLNNHVSNLEWCTMKENAAHYFNNKFKYIVTDDQVKFIRENIDDIGAKRISCMLNINENYIFGVANGTHCPNIHPELIREKRTSFPIEVKKYDRYGRLLETYSSIQSCAKANGVRLSHIQRVLSGERKSISGFIYKSEGYKQFIPHQVVGDWKRKKVEKYDVNGNCLAIFKGKADAAKEAGCSPSWIRDCLQGRVKTVRGFIYRYAESS